MNDGIELRVKVVPRASRSEVAGALGDRLKIRVAAPASGGQANRAVIEVVGRWLDAAAVEIVNGLSRAEKTLLVRGIASSAEEKLRADS